MIAQRLFGAICKRRGHRWTQWKHRTYRVPGSERVWPDASRICTRCGDIQHESTGPEVAR